MKKTLILVFISIVLAASSAVAEDLPRTRTQQPLNLLPPQTQSNTAGEKKSAGTSHKKRNIIIAVVVGAVTGVAIAAHKGVYGSSSNSGAGY